MAGIAYTGPMQGLIIGLLMLVYPSGGGSYILALQNLGPELAEH